MESVGIIAEYNPFHNGHRRQIAFLKEQGVETVAVALSGCFVQRGAPAWTDKMLRTQMALEQGVDFVFELPVLYALSSAEGFAMGGVSLLSALELEGLCFGSECGTLAPLIALADFLVEQDIPRMEENIRKDNLEMSEEKTSAYQRKLRKYIKQGESYPLAREHALSHFFEPLLQEYPDLLSHANNILAIEYLKALKRTDSKLQPVTIRRNDDGYHSLQLEGGVASASAIRKSFSRTGSLIEVEQVLPPEVLPLLQENSHRYPVELDDFSALLYLRLRSFQSPVDVIGYGEISPELANRIWNRLPEYTGFTDFIEQVKTKNYTYSRISRSLLCLLLGITTEQLQKTRQPVPYLRLLGMRKEKSGLLRRVTKLPIITKAADYREILTGFYQKEAQRQDRLGFALECFELDLLAADIYRQVLYQKRGCLLPDEFRGGIRTIP